VSHGCGETERFLYNENDLKPNRYQIAAASLFIYSLRLCFAQPYVELALFGRETESILRVQAKRFIVFLIYLERK